jgi:hypothetical protein
VANLRVLLDENLSPELRKLFRTKVPVHTVADWGMSGAEDVRVIEEVVLRKCLIVTANWDFVDFYRNHEWRRGKDWRYFYGLIFLKHSNSLTQAEQLKLAIRHITADHDNLLTVSPTGQVTVENLEKRKP